MTCSIWARLGAMSVERLTESGTVGSAAGAGASCARADVDATVTAAMAIIRGSVGVKQDRQKASARVRIIRGLSNAGCMDAAGARTLPEGFVRVNNCQCL